jgi:DNA mismatch repair protein MutS
MKLTPMMEQYLAAKDGYADAILFFRMGDFYEMFFEDAVTVSRELDITLTARNKGDAHEIPMAGVPHHAAENYIGRLIKKGYTVAVCDQLEDPRQVKGIVKRGVTRVITPAVGVGTDQLDARSAHYLGAVCASGQGGSQAWGIAFIDASTGDFRATETTQIETLLGELDRARPAELLVAEGAAAALRAELETRLAGTVVRDVPVDSFDRDKVLGAMATQSRVESHVAQTRYFTDIDEISTFFASVSDFGFRHPEAVHGAVSAILGYLAYTQQGVSQHITEVACYKTEDHLILDEATRANLELTETLMGGRRHGSLISVIDQTVTAMGGRRLREWLGHPLINLGQIVDRHAAVEEFATSLGLREDVRERLRDTYDIERLCGKVSQGTANARDLLNLRRTLEQVPVVAERITSVTASLLEELRDGLDPCPELQELLARAIVDEPPVTLRDGGLLRQGYHEELDELITITRDGKDWLLRYEVEQRAATEISSLKVRYNRVFGYYLDVTKANLHLVPDHYIRKQTLANSERYFTAELKEYEDKVLSASDKRIELEFRLFEELRRSVATYLTRLRRTAWRLSVLDVLAGLAEVAYRHDYCRPEMHDGPGLDIEDGRHPVVELHMGGEHFVPNSISLDCDEHQLLIITGPNMAGKSTVIRQVALISLLAQMGGFVPAASARLGIVDKIFSRVGASDNLAKGQSTFMVEMTETAHILKSATARSLIILDEIGRGTATYDGLSIAWAVAEFLHDNVGAKTLFATHYHELTTLSETLHGVSNFNIACKEWKDDIIFLRRLVPGAANRSYGIQVGRLAGLPDTVVDRAKVILENLETTSHDAAGMPVIARRTDGTTRTPDNGAQLSLFAISPHSPQERQALDSLREIDPETLTPIDALNLLYSLTRSITS